MSTLSKFPTATALKLSTDLIHGFSRLRLKLCQIHPKFASTVTSAATSSAAGKVAKSASTKSNSAKESAKTTKPNTQSAQLTKYIESIQSPTNAALLKKSKFARVKRDTGESLCLINDKVASSIADLCQPYISDLNATVIEFNPGLGLLTKELKSKIGLTNVNCFEGNELFSKHLQTTVPDINLINTNFLTLPRLHHMDKLDGGARVYAALGAVKGNSKEEQPTTGASDKLYVFGATPEIDFINFTIKSLVTQKIVFEEDSNVWANKNITYFLTLGAKVYTVINASSELGFTVYRASSILFQLLFNHVVLGHVSRRAFVPWENNVAYVRPSLASATAAGEEEKKPRKKRAQTIPHDPESMCVIKFFPNMQTIDKIGKNNLFTFWYFIRHHLFARSHSVIPELEQWIPGCGPRLIRKGYTIYTQFGSLTPQQTLELYLDFSGWPEFKSSSFLNAMEKYQHKVDAHEEDMIRFSKNPRF